MKQAFEWDAKKAQSNLKKHGIAFDEGLTVFLDPLSITINDPDHSDQEQRHIDIGTSDRGRVLVVVYTERSANLRIISCRKATVAERQFYESC